MLLNSHILPTCQTVVSVPSLWTSRLGVDVAKLPRGVAAVLANTETGRVILCSDTLSARQRATARLVARYKAIGGAAVVVVTLKELLELVA